MATTDLERLRVDLLGVSLVQVVHVTGPAALQQALDVERHVDFILLDSRNPDGPARALRGTGNVHDWRVSSEIVRAVHCPVFLAGGLGPDNVAEAIADVQPFGVDACPRLCRNGCLDEGLLTEFFNAIRDALAF
jgi:phosphoribosylanthranilate isomerase